MDDASRRALRDLARRAEWRGHPGAAGAAQDADSLRALGREMQSALARRQGQDQDQDGATWAHQTLEHLAAYCLKARPDWTPEQIAELARLRDDAVIALAPAPGESDAVPTPTPRTRAALTNLASKQSRLVALAAVGCVVLIALVLTVPHFFSSSSAQTPAASSSTTAASTAPTTPASTPTSAPASTSPSATAPTTSSPSGNASSSSTSHVTAIQITTDPLSGNPPEVILSGTVTASGTDDVAIDITMNGSIPPQLSSSDPIHDSGQTSYDLTQTINLSQWCGQSSVKLTVSSGSISQSAIVPISGC